MHVLSEILSLVLCFMPALLRTAFLYSLLIISLLFLTSQPLWAQEDTLAQTPPDSVQVDTLAVKSDFETTVNYKASDSIRFNVKNQMVVMYNQSDVKYGDISLASYQITLNWGEDELTAIGLEDSLGKLSQTPVFEQAGEVYNAEKIRYNFESEKAIVTMARTQQGEGYLIGEKVKRFGDRYFLRNGIYTTCNDPHPHFGIRSKKLKMVAGKQIITGPFQLEIADIPTPLGFPFGMVPIPKKRSSGIIIPAYGETRERGFFLRDGGLYLALSDYIDLTFLGEIYSRGGAGGRVMSRYKKRYRYDGSVEFRYNNLPQGEVGTANRAVQQDFWLTWSHRPFARGTSRFSASVNAGTSTFNARNSFNPNDYLSSSFTSNVSYSKSFAGTPFSFTSSLRHNQNVQTEVITVSPQASLNMQRIFPLKKLIKKSSSPLAQLGLSYTSQGKIDVTNSIAAASSGQLRTSEGRQVPDTLGFNLSNMDVLLQNAGMGVKHNIPISTAFSLFNYFTVSPQANYTETWYKERYTYNYLGNDTVNIDTVNSFSRFYDYSVSASVTTRFYSTYIFKSKKAEKPALRHMLTPTLSFSYKPDFSDPRFGLYEEIQVDETGRTERIPTMDGVYGRPSLGEQGNISLRLDNNVELKVFDREAQEMKKVKLIDNFSLSTAYNLAADSFNLADLQMSLRTNLFQRISININSSIDPYTWELYSMDSATGRANQRRIPEFAWKNGQGLGSLKRLSFAISTSLNPEAVKSYIPFEGVDPDQLNYINEHPEYYVDFSVPWNLSLNFNFSYTKNGFDEPNLTRTVSFNGDVSLTEKWKVTFRSGYDFELKDFSFTSIDIHRDLHCWQMSVSWIPFGPRQSYTLDIGVKASILQDLKLSRRNNWYDRR